MSAFYIFRDLLARRLMRTQEQLHQGPDDYLESSALHQSAKVNEKCAYHLR